MSFDEIVEKAARRVGSRVTRRSFLGRTAATLTTIGVGGLGFSPSPAYAASCPCSNCGHSTSCGGSFGNGCPSGTCPGGAWYGCTSFCGGDYLTRYRDCMPSNGCKTYCGGDGRPGCYYQTPYGACGGSEVVYCRAVTCVGPSPC